MSTDRSLWAVINTAVMLSLMLSSATPQASEIAIPVAPADARSVLPPVGGDHTVGVRSFSWIDNTRSRTGLPGNGGNREITVTVWYPATTSPDQKQALYAPEIEFFLAAADTVPENRRQFINAHEPLANVTSNSIPDAEPAPLAEGWPVIFFSPGGNVSRHFQTALAEEIASRGFVFISMSHPYSSLDVAPESGFSMSLDWDLDNEDRRIADENDNRLSGILAEDTRFVLKQMRIAAGSGHPLAMAMDLDRPGIAGHSRGGKTVARSCSTNEQFRACAVIDNIGPALERKTGINQPFVTLRSGWSEERVNELHDYLGRTGTVSYDLLLKNSNHFTCTDMPLFISDLRVEGTDPIEGIKDCARIIASFFEAFLASNASENVHWIPQSLSEKVAVRQFTSSARE